MTSRFGICLVALTLWMQVLYLRPYMPVLSHLLGVPGNRIFKKSEIHAIIISRNFLPRNSNNFLHKKQNTGALSRRHHVLRSTFVLSERCWCSQPNRSQLLRRLDCSFSISDSLASVSVRSPARSCGWQRGPERPSAKNNTTDPGKRACRITNPTARPTHVSVLLSPLSLSEGLSLAVSSAIGTHCVVCVSLCWCVSGGPR